MCHVTNMIKIVNSTTQKKCVGNICSREYVDNGVAKKDILGTADIGPARKKGAREANLANIYMWIPKDTVGRDVKIVELFTRFGKKTVRT